MELWPSEHWRVSPTGKHFRLPVTVAMSCDARAIPSIPLPPMAEEFVMRAMVATTFIANPAQYRRAEQRARRILTEVFYRDVLLRLDLVAAEIETNPSNALLLLEELRTALVSEEPRT